MVSVRDGRNVGVITFWKNGEKSGMDWLERGDRVQCESDTKPLTYGQSEGDRDVQVLILEGKYKGRIATIDRCDIRPVKD